MRVPLSPGQFRLLTYLRECRARDYSPTFYEMGDAMGYTHVRAYAVVDQLIERGYVRKLKRTHRNIMLLEENDPAERLRSALIDKFSRGRDAMLARDYVLAVVQETTA